MLEFYARPINSTGPTFENLGKPDDRCRWSDLFFFREGLFASCLRNGIIFRSLKKKFWQNADSSKELPGDLSYVQSVGDDWLVFTQTDIFFRGESILHLPKSYGEPRYYYADGYLVFSLDHVPDGGAGRAEFFAQSWRPGQRFGSDLSGFVQLITHQPDPAMGRNRAISFGNLKGRIYLGSRLGGFYEFDGFHWKTVVPARSRRDEYARMFYSIINYHDELYIGRWPEGYISKFDGTTFVDSPQLPSSPIPLSEAHRYERELQTLHIYGGDLYAGLWPWGELWRFSGGSWAFVRRLFEVPNTGSMDQDGVPYSPRVKKYNWGQRIVSSETFEGAMFLGTGNLDGSNEFASELLADEVTEFGNTYVMKSPYTLSKQMHWSGERVVQLDFFVESEGMAILRDGELIASTRFENPISLTGGLTADWAQGPYGAFKGTILNSGFVEGKNH